MTLTDLLGYSAATLTTVSYLPQAYKAVRTKDTRSLSYGMYAILTIGLALWFAYGIMRGDYAIIVANAITAGLSLLILVTKVRCELFAEPTLRQPEHPDSVIPAPQGPSAGD